MSLIRVDNFAPSAGGTSFGTEGVAKAWGRVNENQSLADGQNISSATDLGVGEAELAFIDDFSSAPSSNVGSNVNSSTSSTYTAYSLPAVSTVTILSRQNGTGPSDQRATVSVFGDLA